MNNTTIMHRGVEMYPELCTWNDMTHDASFSQNAGEVIHPIGSCKTVPAYQLLSCVFYRKMDVTWASWKHYHNSKDVWGICISLIDIGIRNDVLHDEADR